MTADSSAREGTRDYDDMQREIRESQTRIDETIGALRRRFARLAPRHLMEQTMNRMQDKTGGGQGRYETNTYSTGHARGHSSSSMGDMVRNNSVPLALIGLGLGWLALSGSGYDRRIARSGAVHSVRDRAGGAAQYARDTFYSASSTVRDTASQAYERASDAVSSASDSVRHMGGRTSSGGNETASSGTGGSRGMMSTQRVRSATSGLWDMVDDHPLVAGVVGVALGAALGASMPSTRYEDRWIGDYADEATHRAKELAQEAMDRGTRAARAAVEAAKDEVGDAVNAAKSAAKEEANKPS